MVTGNLHQGQQEAPPPPLPHQRETAEALPGRGEEQGGCDQQAPQ